MPPPPPLHYSRSAPQHPLVKKRSFNSALNNSNVESNQIQRSLSCYHPYFYNYSNEEEESVHYDSFFLLPSKEDNCEQANTSTGTSPEENDDANFNHHQNMQEEEYDVDEDITPGKCNNREDIICPYGAAGLSSDDESLSWESGFKSLDDYHNQQQQLCARIDSELTLQLLPSQMFAFLKQTSSPSSSVSASPYPLPPGALDYYNYNINGGLLPLSASVQPQSMALNYTYSIDPFFKETNSSPSLSCSPPHPLFSPPIPTVSLTPNISKYGGPQTMEEPFNLDNDIIELPERRNKKETKTQQILPKIETDGDGEKVKPDVETKENSSENSGKEETKVRRSKRRKISWKRMNPTLFQEIFQWETNQPKVKQSQIEKKFNVNRSTYYRWKKKYLAQ